MNDGEILIELLEFLMDFLTFAFPFFFEGVLTSALALLASGIGELLVDAITSSPKSFILLIVFIEGFGVENGIC